MPVMLILGLLLLVAAGVLTAGMLIDNSKGDIRPDIFGYHLPSLNYGELFVVGVATGAVAILGLMLLLSALRRGSRRRRQVRMEGRSKQQREAELQEENARLARELDQQRRAQGAARPGAPAPAPGATQAVGAPSPARTAAEERRPEMPPPMRTGEEPTRTMSDRPAGSDAPPQGSVPPQPPPQQPRP